MTDDLRAELAKALEAKDTAYTERNALRAEIVQWESGFAEVELKVQAIECKVQAVDALCEEALIVNQALRAQLDAICEELNRAGFALIPQNIEQKPDALESRCVTWGPRRTPPTFVMPEVAAALRAWKEAQG